MLENRVAFFADLEVVVSVLVRNRKGAAVLVAVPPLTTLLAGVLKHTLVDREVFTPVHAAFGSSFKIRLYPKRRLFTSHY